MKMTIHFDSQTMKQIVYIDWQYVTRNYIGNDENVILCDYHLQRV